MNESASYFSVGDRALLVEFGNVIDITINRRVLALCDAISRSKLLGVEEQVPTYRSLLIYFDPRKVKYEQLVAHIKSIEQKLGKSAPRLKGRTVIVPTAYGDMYGPDLHYVAKHNQLSEEEVIRKHSEKEYAVFMIGFIAGFPYLEQVADEIATPRLETPRLKIPAGSIGIAEKQTGIYPMEAPGGWQIIGRTPIKLFDPNWPQPSLLRPGDRVKFKPILHEEFETTKISVLRNTYSPVIKEE